MLFVLVDGDFLGQIVDASVHADARIAALAGILKDLLVRALFAADDRRQDLKPRPFRQPHDLVDDLVDGLPADLLAALRAVRRAAPRP